ncbi:MAG: hypothetical protein WC935_07885 [Thermoleophilia bacterium]
MNKLCVLLLTLSLSVAHGVELQKALGCQVMGTAAAGGWQDGFERVSETHFEPGLGTTPAEEEAVEATIKVGNTVLYPQRGCLDQINEGWVGAYWKAGQEAGHTAIRQMLVADLDVAAEAAGLKPEESTPVQKAALTLFDERYAPSQSFWCVSPLEVPLARLGSGMLALKDHVLAQASERRQIVMQYAYVSLARAVVARMTNEALPDEPASK